jgi:hypothetical protein
LAACILVATVAYVCRVVSAQRPARPDTLHRVANAYFRYGEQAALMARDLSEQRVREVEKRYGLSPVYPNGHYTNREDFEIVTERVDVIDHPRIWEVLRKLNDGSVLGLDTNSWGNWDGTNADWVKLKD